MGFVISDQSVRSSSALLLDNLTKAVNVMLANKMQFIFWDDWCLHRLVEEMIGSYWCLLCFSSHAEESLCGGQLLSQRLP